MTADRQPALPLFGQNVPRLHKAARTTSREAYRRQRAEDIARAAVGGETRVGQALRILAWHWNVTQSSLTTCELFRWAIAHGERLFDVAALRPRLTELVAHGLVEPRARRICTVSRPAWTWAVREVGSAQPR